MRVIAGQKQESCPSVNSVKKGYREQGVRDAGEEIIQKSLGSEEIMLSDK